MTKLMKVWLFVALQIACGAAHAEEIRVLSGGAARGFVEPLAKTFAQPVRIEYQPMGRLAETMAGADAARYDMVVATPEVLEKLKYGNGRPLARVGIGVAVNEKAPLPDISTPEALKKTLLAAKSVVHINPQTGTSGKYVVEMFGKLGILEQMRGKTTLVDQGYAVAPVGRGEVELGIHQISEILPVKGVRLAGPLPPELQKYTVYAGAPVPGTQNSQAVAEFIRHLTSAEARGKLAAAGYTAPE
jgi:molybdate transport system substrate-binding protein